MKGVFILVIMKRLIYDWFLAIVAIFLLLTTTLADQVEDDNNTDGQHVTIKGIFNASHDMPK